MGGVPLVLRIARRQRARLRYTFTDAEGNPVQPAGGVAVTVYRDTDPVVNGAATVPDDPVTDPAYEFAFASPHTDALGPLRAEWVATIDDDVQTFESWHEVVGAHVVGVAQLRRREALQDPDRYPAWLLELARDTATYALEDACNTAFVRRRRVDTTQDSRTIGKVALKRARDVSLAAGTVDARVLAAQELSGLRVERGGLVTGDALNVNAATLTYEYGYNSPPPHVARAVELIAEEWAREQADDLSVPARATMIDSDAGNIRLVTAGEFGRIFDIPDANAVVKLYRE